MLNNFTVDIYRVTNVEEYQKEYNTSLFPRLCCGYIGDLIASQVIYCDIYSCEDLCLNLQDQICRIFNEPCHVWNLNTAHTVYWCAFVFGGEISSNPKYIVALKEVKNG